VGTSPFSLVDQARFRAGFDFLRLRAQVGEVEEELAHWWETFQHASDEVREDMVDAQRRESLAKPGPGKARRVKRSDADHPAQSTDGAIASPAVATPTAPLADPRFGVKAHTEADPDDSEPRTSVGFGSAFSADSETETSPAKKRRRRRRKPTGDGGQGGESPAAD
jgi:poly(A) polymerase